MTRNNHLPIFIAGIAIGVAAAVVLMDEELRSQVGTMLRQGSTHVSDALADPQAAWKRGGEAMSGAKEKLTDTLNGAASAAKSAVDNVVDKSREAAHKAGEHLERSGRRLQDA